MSVSTLDTWLGLLLETSLIASLILVVATLGTAALPLIGLVMPRHVRFLQNQSASPVNFSFQQWVIN